MRSTQGSATPEELPEVLVQREVAARALESERQRLLFIAIAFSVLMAVFGTTASLVPGLVHTIFHDKLGLKQGLPAASGVVLYALGSRAWLARLQRQGRMPPRPFAYLVAFVEISIPSLLILALFTAFDPILALQAPPLLLYGLFIVLSALRLDPALSIFTGAVAAAEYFGLSLLAMQATTLSPIEPMMVHPLQHLGKAVLLFVSGLVTGLAARRIQSGLTTSIRALHERNHIVDVFGKHVSPEVVNKLLAQRSEMVSESRYVCVMFLDIRDFTTFSESRKPEEVVAFLNRLFAFMIDEISERGGIINKFLGDGFMAIFGAPLSTGDDCANAVAAARAILARVDAEVSAGAIPPTRIGIALHAGAAITGHVGSARRREYTVIGDVVNVAARIEQLNKRFASKLLVSDVVIRALGTAESGAEALGPVEVKGRESAVEVYRLSEA